MTFKALAVTTLALLIAPLAGAPAWAQSALDQLENMGGGLPPPPPTPPAEPVDTPEEAPPPAETPTPTYQAPTVYYHPPIYYYHPPIYTPPAPAGPSPAQIRLQQAHNQAAGSNQGGILASRKNNWAAAVADFRRALSLWPNNATIRHNLDVAIANEEFRIGLAAQNRGDLEAALAAYRRAHNALPNDPTVNGNLAAVLGLLRQKQELNESRPRIAAILDTPPPPASSPSTGGGLNFMNAAPATDPLAGVEPPVPTLAAMNWSPAFPSGEAPAAVVLAKAEFDKLAGAASAARDWIGGKAIDAAGDKAKDAAIGGAIKLLPISDALKDESQWQADMAQRYKGLFDEMNKDTQNYLLGFERVTSSAAGCLGGGGDCAAPPADVQVVANRYADQSSDRWKSWVNDDMKARLSRFFGVDR